MLLLRCAARLSLWLTLQPSCVPLAAHCLPAACCSSSCNDTAGPQRPSWAPGLHTSLCDSHFRLHLHIPIATIYSVLQRRMGWQVLSW